MISVAAKAVQDIISCCKISHTLKYYNLINYAIHQTLLLRTLSNRQHTQDLCRLWFCHLKDILIWPFCVISLKAAVAPVLILQILILLIEQHTQALTFWLSLRNNPSVRCFKLLQGSHIILILNQRKNRDHLNVCVCIGMNFFPSI